MKHSNDVSLQSVPTREIVRRNPVDTTAARVTGTGVHYEGFSKYESPGLQESDLPLPHSQFRIPQDFEFRGKRFGRLTVIAPAEIPGDNKPRRYMCRCQCGRYCYRRSKALRKSLVECLQCHRCNHLRTMKNGFWVGKDAVEREGKG